MRPSFPRSSTASRSPSTRARRSVSSDAQVSLLRYCRAFLAVLTPSLCRKRQEQSRTLLPSRNGAYSGPDPHRWARHPCHGRSRSSSSRRVHPSGPSQISLHLAFVVQALISREVPFSSQDATLFSGTLRENLDPFKQHSDEVLFDMLRRVHLVSDGSSSTAAPSRIPSTTNLIDLSDRVALSVPSASNAAGMPLPSGQGVLDVSDSSTMLGTPVPASSAASFSTEVTERKSSITLDSLVSGGGANFSQGQRRVCRPSLPVLETAD